MKNEFKNNYSKKILTQDALKKVLGKKPRKKKLYYVRNFDVVHPGHVRHFNAKSKADILAVSITADKFIQKREL